MAPEHLHISVAHPESMLARVQNAGAIFMGHYTPVDLGDYVAGPSHVLPTGGTARFANGLCANDFLKRSSVISYNRAALAEVAADVRLMTAIAHARAGNRGAAEILIGDFEARTPRPDTILLQWHAAQGNHDAAFQLLQRRPPTDAIPAVMRVDPLFDAFRADRRFAATR